MLSKEELTEEQLNICRDIRRRGKNKVAAQNCRKRKLEQIDELQHRLEESRRRQYRLLTDHEKLLSVYNNEASKLTRLTDTVLAHHHKNPAHYTVQVEGEDVKVVPKTTVNPNDRIPKPVECFRLHIQPEYQKNMEQSSCEGSVYTMDQSGRRGWE